MTARLLSRFSAHSRHDVRVCIEQEVDVCLMSRNTIHHGQLRWNSMCSTDYFLEAEGGKSETLEFSTVLDVGL